MDNRKRTIRIFLVATGILTGILSAFAAENDSTGKVMPAQITFIYPLGTNGIGSAGIKNKFSINVIGGVNGGVHGFEAGGCLNIDLGDVDGAQFGGLANYVHENMNGAQFGGLVNYVHGRMDGAQFAGLANVNEKGAEGAMFSGLTNIVNGRSRGAFFAGLANIHTDYTRGAQFSGMLNLNLKESKSTQVAGLCNTAVDSTNGLQLAGLMNVSVRRHQGAQVAGLINYTTRLNGFQLGFLNVADTVEKGVPFGFISLVRTGYHEIEIESNDLFYANVNLKTGVKPLYNIFSIGYRLDRDQHYWGVTYGLGTYASLSDRVSLNCDLTATQINEGRKWTNKLNMVNRLKLNIGFRLAKNLELYGGGSLNMALSQMRNEEGILTGSPLLPSYGIYEDIIGSTHMKIYPGFNFGIRI